MSRTKTNLTSGKSTIFGADAPMMLLSLSRVAYEKNIKEIIDGFATILETIPNAYLMIVGDGPAKEDVLSSKAMILGWMTMSFLPVRLIIMKFRPFIMPLICLFRLDSESGRPTLKL